MTLNIKDLVKQVEDGKMTAEELGTRLAAVVKAAPPTGDRSDEEVAELARRAANDEIDEFQPNSLGEVIAAYYGGRLTDEQYAAIMGAMTGKGDTDA